MPADASVLIVASPRTALFEQEAGAIEAYLEGGGKAMFMQEPGAEVDMGDVLADWGVAYQNDVIIDPDRALFGMNPFSPVVDSFTFHEITKELPSVVVSTARSVTETVEQAENISILALVESSDGSWGETDFEALDRQEAQYDAGQDTRGPLEMVTSVESQGGGEEEVPTRLVISGDSDFAANSSFMMGGNGDLFLNSVNWLAEEEELISIRPKPPVSRTLILSPGEARFVQYSSLIILPAAVLVVGAAVWWRRR